MAYVNKPRPYKKEYQQDLKNDISGAGSRQHERQRARRLLDKKGVDRTGKDIDHIKPIRSGGKSNPANIRLRSKKANQSDNGK